MVLHKRLEYGFNGYQRPPTPRATRSPRKRSIPRSKTDENQICAFDLLATVADVLNDKEHSASWKDSVKNEENNADKSFNAELSRSGVCRKSFFVSELVKQPPISNNCSTEHPHSQGDTGSVPVSVITTSDGSVKIGSSDQIVRDRNKYLLESSDVGNMSIENRENRNSCFNKDHISSGCVKKKIINKCQRPLRDYPIKKRRLYDYSSVRNSRGSSFDEDCGSTLKRSNAVAGASASSAVERTSLKCRDSRVKLKIKSFRVPELLFEIPETATVGSLKRTVMEAVTAILGDGLHVGILQHGKKMRDDNRTLLQTGISHNNKSDALGFILENNNSPAPVSGYPKGHSLRQSCESPKPLPRYLDVKKLVHNSVQHKAANNTMSTHGAGSYLTNFVESEHDSAPSPPDMSQEKTVADSRALVAVPSKTAEALNMVLMRKPKSSESARRIRRPFTVSEVEALVQAVEKLGTGRWRDVKLRAFDNAKHRTYVDLKDKWKTLVHTARISPQQRRGEPVPQELLDRVLLAHAYWSQQQAKLQLKQHSKLAFSESLICRNTTVT